MSKVVQASGGVQSFDLDGMGTIPAIPPVQFTCFIDEFNKLAWYRRVAVANTQAEVVHA